jgi:anti-anti-sigma factor
MTPPDRAVPRDYGALSIREVRIGARAILAVSGDIDMATADRIRPAVAGAAESGATEVWLDLSDVRFADSSGMHAILACREAADAAKASFLVVCPDGPVLRVLRMLGLEREVTVHPDRASAHAAR